MRLNKEVSEVGWGRVWGTEREDRWEGRGGPSAQRVGGHAVTQGPPLRPQHQHLRLQGTKQDPLPSTNLSDTTFGCFIFNIFFFTKTSKR